MDEATNSFNVSNELVILKNLQQLLMINIILVVVHRLSTGKNEDKIMVLEDGEIVEESIQAELVLMKGKYYGLVKNQLEPGNYQPHI